MSSRRRGHVSMDVPKGATVWRFNTAGEAWGYARKLEEAGYIRPAHGSHIQGLRPGKFVVFPHAGSWWVGHMEPKRGK